MSLGYARAWEHRTVLRLLSGVWWSEACNARCSACGKHWNKHKGEEEEREITHCLAREVFLFVDEEERRMFYDYGTHRSRRVPLGTCSSSCSDDPELDSIRALHVGKGIEIPFPTCRAFYSYLVMISRYHLVVLLWKPQSKFGQHQYDWLKRLSLSRTQRLDMEPAVTVLSRSDVPGRS